MCWDVNDKLGGNMRIRERVRIVNFFVLLCMIVLVVIIVNNKNEIVSAENVLNGCHYINNKGTGRYLYYDGSSNPSGKSGSITNFGTKIRWSLTYSGTSYFIRSDEQPNKYLSVTNTAGGSSISITTISSPAYFNTAPSSCRWNIISVNGGYLIKNASNSYYLYVSGNSLYLSSSLGTVGTSTYNSRIWRISEPAEVPASKELAIKTKFFDNELKIGRSESVKKRLFPADAFYSDVDDFTYSSSNSSIASVNAQGIINPVSVGTAIITCVHKPTGRQFSSHIYVNSLTTNKGNLNYWYNIEGNVIGNWDIAPYFYREALGSDGSGNFISACDYAISSWNNALPINMFTTSVPQDGERSE